MTPDTPAPLTAEELAKLTPPYPASHSFADVNAYVHEPDRHFEELQWLCLGLASDLEKKDAARRPAPGDAGLVAWLEGQADYYRGLRGRLSGSEPSSEVAAEWAEQFARAAARIRDLTGGTT